MSFIFEKNDIFTEIAVAQTVDNNFPKIKKESSIPSANSKSKNLLPFIVDLQTALIGSDDMKRFIKNFFIEFLKEVEVKSKDSIVNNLKLFFCGTDFSLPSGDLLQVNISDLDLFDQMKEDPKSVVGRTIFGDGGATDFNTFLHSTIQIGSGNYGGLFNIDVVSGNTKSKLKISIDDNYCDPDPITGKCKIKIKKFISDYFKSTKLIFIPILYAKLMDFLFGSISKLLNKDYEQILEEKKLDKTIDKILDKDETDEVIYDDSFFTFSNLENREIENSTTQSYNGVNVGDLVCGVSNNSINLERIVSNIELIRNTNQSRLATQVSNVVSDSLDEAVSGVSDENRNNSFIGLVKELIKGLPKILLKILLGPHVMVIFQTVNSLVNGTKTSTENTTNNAFNNIPNSGAINFGDPTSFENNRIDEFIRKSKTFLVAVIKDIYSFIVEYLYKFVKDEILKLVAIVATKVIKEQLEIFKGILLASAPKIVANASNQVINSVGNQVTNNIGN